MTGLLPPQQPPWLLLSHKPAGLPSQEQRWSRVLVARRSPLADVVVCLPCPSPVLPGWGGPTGGLQLSPLTGRLRLTVPFCGLSCSSGMGTGPLSCLEAGGGSGMGLGRAGSQRPAGHSGHPPGPGVGPPRGRGRGCVAGMCQDLVGSAPAPGSGLLGHTHLTDRETEAWRGAAAVSDPGWEPGAHTALLPTPRADTWSAETPSPAASAGRSLFIYLLFLYLCA